jgi:hypothetical protein
MRLMLHTGWRWQQTTPAQQTMQMVPVVWILSMARLLMLMAPSEEKHPLKFFVLVMRP